MSTIWTKPKLTLEFIFNHFPRKYVTGLLILGGVANAINHSVENAAGHPYLFVIVFIFVVVFGGLFGWIFSFLYAALLSWTGKWINGRAKTDQFMTVIAWAMVPSICSLILVIPKLIIFGDSMFQINIDEHNTITKNIYYILQSIDAILSIWTTVILVKGIYLIQNFMLVKQS